MLVLFIFPTKSFLLCVYCNKSQTMTLKCKQYINTSNYIVKL